MRAEKSSAPKILVVEDDESMRDLLRLHLGNAGYQVALAEDATVAGRSLLASPPDLVIADIHLPFLNGLEFASLLLADSTVPNVPVVLISAHEHYRQRAEALGITFLLKPILKAQLLETVAKVLSSANAEPGSTCRETVHQATLRRARDLAGGVSYLGRKLGIGVNSLDAMIHGNQEIPQWVFLQAAEFVADAEANRETPPGFPADWDSAEWFGDAQPQV